MNHATAPSRRRQTGGRSICRGSQRRAAGCPTTRQPNQAPEALLRWLRAGQPRRWWLSSQAAAVVRKRGQRAGERRPRPVPLQRRAPRACAHRPRQSASQHRTAGRGVVKRSAASGVAVSARFKRVRQALTLDGLRGRSLLPRAKPGAGPLRQVALGEARPAGVWRCVAGADHRPASRRSHRVPGVDVAALAADPPTLTPPPPTVALSPLDEPVAVGSDGLLLAGGALLSADGRQAARASTDANATRALGEGRSGCISNLRYRVWRTSSRWHALPARLPCRVASHCSAPSRRLPISMHRAALATLAGGGARLD